MTDELSALDLWRIADTKLFNREESVADVKLAGEMFAVTLTVAAAKIDSRIEVPPIRWREITDGKDYYAYRGAMHDRKEWLECAKESLRKGVFLADVPPGWLGPLPPFPLRTTAAFVEWLRHEADYVQGFLSSPNREHPEWQLSIAQHAVHNANTWLALHLKREIPPTPGDTAECARLLVNLLVTLEKSSSPNEQLEVVKNESTPSVTWPVGKGWEFRPGEAAFRGTSFKIIGNPATALQVLARRPGQPVLKQILWDAISPEVSAERGCVNDALKVVRRILKATFQTEADPIPCVDKRPSAWKLDESVFP